MAAAASSLPSSRQSEEDLRAQQQEEISALQQQLHQLSVKMEEVGGDMRQLTTAINQVPGHCRCLSNAWSATAFNTLVQRSACSTQSMTSRKLLHFGVQYWSVLNL